MGEDARLAEYESQIPEVAIEEGVPQVEAPYPHTHALGGHYEGEQEPGNAVWAGQARDVTHYAYGDEQAQNALTFVDGEAYRGGDAYQGGDALDTFGQQRAGWKDSRPDRDIFVMDDQGQFYAADAVAEQKARPGERFHHSSLVAGDEVAAAGEMQVRDGTVEVISDRSGHYRPDLYMTGQAVDGLEAQGVEVEAVGVELGEKGEWSEERAGGIEVQAYSSDAVDSDVDAMLAAGQITAEQAMEFRTNPEALLRHRHGVRDTMQEELLRRTAGTRADLDADAVIRARELAGQEVNRGDVQDELLQRMAGRREELDASAGEVEDRVDEWRAAQARARQVVDDEGYVHQG